VIEVIHTSSRTSATFNDNDFEVTGVPMTNNNTIIIIEAPNVQSSQYGDEAFTAKPNGSSYTISVRGLKSQNIFADVETLHAYIIEKLNCCFSMLEKRNT
jgi:hypothetical protein